MMVQDCAMQILEIIMNSNHAAATCIDIQVAESAKENVFSFCVIDNGIGIAAEKLPQLTDPFVTSRTTRKVGMGLAFLKGLTEQCNGTFEISSAMNSGTNVYASIQRDHLDTPPLGNLGEMMMIAIQANEQIDYQLTYKTDQGHFTFTTEEVRNRMQGLSLLEPSILLWIQDYINQEIQLVKEKSV